MDVIRVVVINPVKHNKVLYVRDMVVDMDAAIAEPLIEEGIVRPVAQLQAPSAVLLSEPSPASRDMPVAETFEAYCDAGNSPESYPPSGFQAADTAAWRAYCASRALEQGHQRPAPANVQELRKERVNVGFEPVIRPIVRQMGER